VKQILTCNLAALGKTYNSDVQPLLCINERPSCLNTFFRASGLTEWVRM